MKKITKLVNDLSFNVLWTRVRLPPSPPPNKHELTDEQLEHVCGGMQKEMFNIYATDLINNNLFYKQKEKP